MFSKAHYLLQLRFLVSASNHRFCTDSASKVAATCSTICPNQAEIMTETTIECPRNSSELFKKWGCTENDLLNIFSTQPSLRRAKVTPLLSKLEILSSLGITTSDLVKMIDRRPYLLCGRINKCFHERLEFFMTLFGSPEVLHKAVVKHPSLLTYDFHNRIKPVVACYEEMGIRGNDLTAMLFWRPLLIPRISFNEEKMEFIKKTGVSKDSKLYKYLVVLIGMSRVESIQEKVANLEKYLGCSEHEVWSLLGRLETTLKPRFLLAEKLMEMDLQPQITRSNMIRAMRMKESKFLTVYVKCHPQNVVAELEFYKRVKQLAGASKKAVKGFPF
ncbi:Mitochodrial transcription termination factor-related protein [Corchorus capsularis]|uniref:Mitochodrial transcription termination factor-related protein n=1 Tax=Corchorus capsularis TaxID=210143 RepID=A0A1R3H635_COCAP|nr:Mitochodrial transcription termination factor-related protein [Corchorus capsularis]